MARAAVMHEVGVPLQVERITVAAPQGREVLVRPVAAGLCHSDLLFLEGHWPHPIPTVLGHEVAGVVEAVGSGVTSVQVGDHVLGCAGGGCHECRFCVSGRPIICIDRNHDRAQQDQPRLRLADGTPVHQYGQLSAFAELMLVHEHAVVKIDPEIDLQLASIVGCGVATGLGAVLNTARVPVGASVVVAGVGGVGLNAVQGARIAGASEVIAVDIMPGKLEFARALGATAVIDASITSAVESVRELTDGGADYVFETSGVPAVAEACLEMVGNGGTVVLVGIPSREATVSLRPADLIPREIAILTSHVGSLRPSVDIPRYLTLFERGQLHLEPLVSGRFPLDDINEGFAAMPSGATARSIIVFDS
jgi:S-(hydroxymethyl)glutathione dehydrogenase/alcohol dehydrogenase